MRHMLKTVISHAKEDPKEFISAVALLITLMAVLYTALWFNAVCNGSTY